VGDTGEKMIEASLKDIEHKMMPRGFRPPEEGDAKYRSYIKPSTHPGMHSKEAKRKIQTKKKKKLLSGHLKALPSREVLGF